MLSPVSSSSAAAWFCSRALALVLFLTFSAGAWAQSDLVLNHSDSPDPGAAQGIFTYTMRINNNGPDMATGVTLTDNLPAGSQFISASTTAGSCPTVPAAGRDGTVGCNLGNLPFTSPSSFVTVAIQVRLPSAGVWTNTATASSATPDQNLANNMSAEQTTALQAADLSIAVTSTATAIVAGQSINFSLVSTNNGPNVVPAGGTLAISFSIPTGGAVLSEPGGTGWTCSPGGFPRSTGSVTCLQGGPLAAGASAPALNVLATTTLAGNVSFAFATSATQADNSAMPDPNQNNNTIMASVTSSAGSEVDIAKTAASPQVAVGGNVTYTLTPRFRGGQAPGATSPGITVTDTLGAGLSYVSAGGAGWTCGAAGQLITCMLPGPYLGGNFTTMPLITVVATANVAGILGNQATISIPEPDPTPGNNTAFANVTASNDADLQMNKRASMTVVVPNQDYVYVLSATNIGPLPVGAPQTIRIVDVLPASLQLMAPPTAGAGWICSVSPAAAYPVSGATVTCDRSGPLAVGETTPVIDLTVRSPAAGTATNNACVSLSGPSQADSNATNNCRGVAVNTSATSADLQAVSKTASPATVAAGQDLTYVVTVFNNGPDDSTNVTVTDLLTDLVTNGGFRSAVPSQGSCTPSGVTNGPSVDLSCNLGTLATGRGATVTIVVRPAVAGVRGNSAYVSSPTIGDPGGGNNAAIVTSTVTAAADLVAGKTATPATLPAGSPLTYVASVSNSGPSTAQSVTLTDTLPANAAFINLVSANGGTCTVPAAGAVGGTLTCTWASIPDATQRAVTYRVRPLLSAAGANVINTVSVSATTADTNTANNSATTSTPVIPAALDILVNKVDSVDPVDLGGMTTYTIRINNAGPSFGNNVVLTDVFPAVGPVASAQFSYQGALTVDQGGVCSEPALGALAGTLSCTFPGLDAGQTAIVTYQMRAETLTVAGSTSGTAYNRASVTVNEAELTLTNNSVLEGTTSRRTLIATDLGIAKSVDLANAQAGNTLVYTVTATNNGPSPSNGAQVVDSLPAGTTFVSAPGCVAAGSSVTCLVGPLAVGASRAFVVTATIDAPYLGGGSLVNTAAVDAPGDTDPTNNTASAITQVATTPVVPVVGPGTVQPVPSLSAWAMMLLAPMLGWMGMRNRRRREQP